MSHCFFDFPNNLKAYDLIWNSGNTIEKRRILGDAMNCLELKIKDDLIEEFRIFCFGKTFLDFVNTQIYAKKMFEWAKEEAGAYNVSRLR